MSDRLAGIEKRWTKRPIGNYKVRRDKWSDGSYLVTDNAGHEHMDGIEGELAEIHSADFAKLLAGAPADIAWLIAEVRRLRG